MTQVRIGEAARGAGVSIQTLRFYERMGLLPRPARGRNGYRLYGDDVVERVQFIRQAQALGFHLAEIKEILIIRDGGRSPCDCVRESMEKKIAEVERQMAGLVAFRRKLKQLLRRSRTLPRRSHQATAICPIIQLSRPEKSGPVPGRGSDR